VLVEGALLALLDQCAAAYGRLDALLDVVEHLVVVVLDGHLGGRLDAEFGVHG
jgi:hypothetical protein